MADPFRQISHRRFPPFPGTSNSRRNISVPGQEMNGDNEAKIENFKAFLASNPEILEEIVLDSVDASQLNKWTNQKKHLEKKTLSSDSTLGLPQTHHPHIQEKYTGLNPVMVQKELMAGFQSKQELLPNLNGLANVIGTALRSDSVAMYVIRSGEKELYLYLATKDGYQLSLAGASVLNSTVSAHVAKTKQSVVVSDLHVDERFPLGIGVEGSLIQSVLCVPFTLTTGDVICVMQFGRDWQHQVFNETDLQLATAMVSWAGLAIHQHKVSKSLLKQGELNDFLLEVSKAMFNDIVVLDSLVERIMTYAKDLVEAERCALFLVDHEKRELHANLLDEGVVIDGKPLFTKKDTIRFPMDKGIAGFVSRTGEVVNIKDAYSDKRFNRQIDSETGYTTLNILCMPIISKGEVVGVVQMINKVVQHDDQSMGFTEADVSAFKMFAIYCALALHYSKLYSELQCHRAQTKVAQEMLCYHWQCSEDDYKHLMANLTLREVPADLDSFYFYGPESHPNKLPQLFFLMFGDMFGPDSFDRDQMGRFLLTVRKSYRPVPYHNWKHGFNVAHCMFCILKRLQNSGLISELRMKALLVASLCHDVDHRGYNNTFFSKFNSPLAKLYDTSVMEQHHYATTVMILQKEENNIFSDLSSEDYKQALAYIKHTIIATDLALYFPNQKKLSKLLLSQSVDLDNSQHLEDVLDLIMTAADLSVVAKPWDMQKDAVQYIYQEFYFQGDQEKQLGETPIPMMDRDNQENVPKDQVGFIKYVCLPCYQTLAEIMPETDPLLQGCKDNLWQWERVTEGKSTKTWNPLKSVVARKE